MNDSILVFSRSNDIDQTAAISGSGTVSTIGTGNLTFDAAMSYTGSTVVAAGTLSVTGSGNNRLPADRTVDVQPGATLSVLSTDALPTGANAIDLILTGTLHLDNASAHVGDLTLNDGAAITSTGNASLTLNGALTLQGSTSVSIGAGLVLPAGDTISSFPT